MKRFILSALTALLLPAVSSFGAGYSDGKLIVIDLGALQLDNLSSVAGDGIGVSNGVFFIRIGNGIQITNGVLTVTPGTGLSVSNGVLFATAGGGTNDFQTTLNFGNTSTTRMDFTSFDSSGNAEFILLTNTNALQSPRIGSETAHIMFEHDIIYMGNFQLDDGNGANIQVNDALEIVSVVADLRVDMQTVLLRYVTDDMVIRQGAGLGVDVMRMGGPANPPILFDDRGVWQVEGSATNGQEIVNFDTMNAQGFLTVVQGLSNVLAVSNDAGGQSATNFSTIQTDAVQLGTNTPITGQVIRSFLTNGQANVDFTSPLTVDSSPVLTEASETNLIVFTWTSIGNLTGASSFDGLRVLPSDAEIISFWAVTDDAGTAGNTISVSLNFSDIAGSDNTIQTNGWTLAEVTDPTSRLDLQGNGQATARVLYTNSLFSVTNFSLGDVFSVDIEDSGAQASDLIVQAVFRKN